VFFYTSAGNYLIMSLAAQKYNFIPCS